MSSAGSALSAWVKKEPGHNEALAMKERPTYKFPHAQLGGRLERREQSDVAISFSVHLSCEPTQDNVGEQASRAAGL